MGIFGSFIADPPLVSNCTGRAMEGVVALNTVCFGTANASTGNALCTNAGAGILAGIAPATTAAVATE